MSKIVSMGVIIAIMMLGGAGSAAETGKEKAALEAAETWLLLIDKGEYAESYEAASSYLRNAVTLEQWEQSIKAVRVPLGDVVSRDVKNTTYTENLPAAPDGEYVVIRLDTVFENKAKTVETVTPMIDKDGAWRVSGYYIN